VVVLEAEVITEIPKVSRAEFEEAYGRLEIPR
jgi:hypothetical protein